IGDIYPVLRYWDMVDTALKGVDAQDTAAIDVAMRGVLRRILAEMPASAPDGDPNARLIFFRTNADGVVLPPHLRQKYPDEMSVILQYQYRDLMLGEQGLAVSASFDGIWEKLTVPWTAVKAFDDQTLRFRIGFHNAKAKN